MKPFGRLALYEYRALLAVYFFSIFFSTAMSRRNPQRVERFQGNYDENPIYFARYRELGKGFGVRCTRQGGAPPGTEVGPYGGRTYTLEEKDAVEELAPSDKWLQVRHGMAPLFVRGNDTMRSSLAASVNYECGVDVLCNANCKVIFDDLKRKQAYVVTTRWIPQGQWLAMDYGYRYVEARDGNDLSMGWMKGLRCTVCFPDRPPMGRASLASRAPVIAILMDSGSTDSLSTWDYDELRAVVDEHEVEPMRLIPHFLECGQCSRS